MSLVGLRCASSCDGISGFWRRRVLNFLSEGEPVAVCTGSAGTDSGTTSCAGSGTTSCAGSGTTSCAGSGTASCAGSGTASCAGSGTASCAGSGTTSCADICEDTATHRRAQARLRARAGRRPPPPPPPARPPPPAARRRRRPPPAAAPPPVAAPQADQSGASPSPLQGITTCSSNAITTTKCYQLPSFCQPQFPGK
jgi:hypothetical protein